MTTFRHRIATAALALAWLAPAGAIVLTGQAQAQVSSLFYKEVERDGRIYVFNTAARYKSWQASGDIGTAVTMIGQGPAGETVVAENETAMDLYNFKHDRPAYERPASKPASAPSAPTTLKIGDGELKFGLLLQGWYVTDDSPAATGSSFLGNTTGYNTFRLRRAEIKLNGKITPDWGFEVMFDPAKSQNVTGSVDTDSKILQDLAITYLGLKGHEFSLGQKKIVLTEEGVRSSSELDFAERAQVTKTFSDRRETGFFYKGEYDEHVGALVSITNGTISNSLSNTNDTVFGAARIDVKPIPGLLVGASGGTGAVNGGVSHLDRTRWAFHVKYDGTDDLPIGFRAEYLKATDEQAGKPSLNRDGFYVTVLYTLEKQFQLGLRYDEINNNKDADGNKIKTLTAGFHYLIKGKNINLKLDYFNIKQDNRMVLGSLAEKYSQFVLAAQVAF
jgi:Phosphate-selective porin O and P